MEKVASKRLLLIINPVAGKCKNHKQFSEVIDLLKKNGYMVKVMMTQQHRDATKFTIEYARNFDIVVCMGGDGTVNETIMGLVKSGFYGTLGYIPSGTTNYFARCHRIPLDVVNAVDGILDQNVKAINIGRFDNDYFVFVAAFGMFSDLTYSTSQKVKNFIGYPAYVLEGIKRLSKLESVKMRITTQNSIFEGEYIFGIVSNYSSVVSIVTKRKKNLYINDDKFEVILIRKPNSPFEWADVFKSLLSNNYESKLIDFFNTDFLEIETEESIAWTLDGELEISKTRVQLKKIKNAVNLFLTHHPN